MRICVLTVVIVVTLTNDSCANRRTKQNNLIITYDPGYNASSEAPISPRFASYGQITADDLQYNHPKQYGRIRFEDAPFDQPVKFEDEHKDPVVVRVSFDSVKNSDQNGRILNADTFDDESNQEHSESKIKFNGSNNKPENDPQSNKLVFEDKDKSEADDDVDNDLYNYSSNSETEEEPSDKSTQSENNSDDAISDNKNKDSDRENVTERVVFISDNNKNKKQVPRSKIKLRRRPRYQTLQKNPAQVAGNSHHPGLGYPGYPGVGFPGYPMSAFYPNSFPSPYPGVPFPTAVYPEFPPNPGPPYSPMTPGYGLYPTPGYQGQGDQKRPVNPIAYPNSQPGQSEHIDTRYPNHNHAWYPPSGATQSAIPEAPHPEYPYYQGYPVSGYNQAYPWNLNSQYAVQPQYRPPGAVPGYQNGQYIPSRRPKSLIQQAVSTVAEALTSIAMYDDKQCVPKILCEVAGGSTISSPALRKATTGLQPLLSLLQVYNGISTSPLFVFGRAAVTGMTANGNSAVCRHAYPQCPSDPETLVNYLNNHNGGFFRFFGQPGVPQKPYNLEQFYNYLSGQGQQQQQQNNYPNANGYGLLPQNPYPNSQNIGNINYRGFRNAKNIASGIEERIQNKPGLNVLEDENELSSIDNQDENSKWLFPDKASNDVSEGEIIKIKNQPETPTKVSKTLKFPDDRSDDMREIHKPRDHIRKQKHIFFPGESKLQFNVNYQTTTPVNPEEYVFDHKHNFYVKKLKSVIKEDVVYVVRGNGDPNNPEIVKVRPGQSI